jgi:hypothetical protein
LKKVVDKTKKMKTVRTEKKTKKKTWRSLR